MEEKHKQNIFLKVLLILFIIFMMLYFMDNLGYYNVYTKNKVLTEKRIQEFENDIKNGKSIDIKNYALDDTNYKNVYSNIGYQTSNFIDKLLNKELKKIGKLLKKLFS